MNQITSKKWDSMTLLNQVNLISKHFTSPQFAQLYKKPVTVLPGVNTLVLLRTCRTATLEVLENYDTGTVYRIRQTGVVIRVNADSSEYIYPSLETYLLTPLQGSLIFKFPSKEIVYTFHHNGYLNKIKRHKKPRFIGTIEFSDNQVLDGQTGIHINIADLSWIDPAPLSSKEIDTVVKKTVLFIRANYPAQIAESQKKSPLQGEATYRVEEPNEEIIYGRNGTGRSLMVIDDDSKHYPNPNQIAMNIYFESIQFIQAYRRMEKGTLKFAKTVIEQLSDHHIHQHLLAAWKGKDHNFGDWFLNLSHSTQGEIIRIFGQGVDDPTIDKYIIQKNSDPVATLWLDPPPLVKRYHELLKFFYNHGINEEPATGVKLPAIPVPDKRYGNSENWGEYILSLNPMQQQYVISQIFAYLRLDGEPNNHQQPKPFNPSKEDLTNAAQTLAKYFSPNKVLTDPDTGEYLARGERNTTPDQDTP